MKTTKLDSGARAASTGDRYLTRREIAAKFSASEQHFERLHAKGEGPPTVKIGRSVRYSERLADEWARELMVKAESKDAA